MALPCDSHRGDAINEKDVTVYQRSLPRWVRMLVVVGVGFLSVSFFTAAQSFLSSGLDATVSQLMPQRSEYNFTIRNVSSNASAPVTTAGNPLAALQNASIVSGLFPQTGKFGNGKFSSKQGKQVTRSNTFKSGYSNQKWWRKKREEKGDYVAKESLFSHWGTRASISSPSTRTPNVLPVQEIHKWRTYELGDIVTEHGRYQNGTLANTTNSTEYVCHHWPQ